MMIIRELMISHQIFKQVQTTTSLVGSSSDVIWTFISQYWLTTTVQHWKFNFDPTFDYCARMPAHYSSIYLFFMCYVSFEAVEVSHLICHICQLLGKKGRDRRYSSLFRGRGQNGQHQTFNANWWHLAAYHLVEKNSAIETF